MEELFSTGRIIDLILVGVAIEAVVLLVLCRGCPVSRPSPPRSSPGPP